MFQKLHQQQNRIAATDTTTTQESIVSTFNTVFRNIYVHSTSSDIRFYPQQPQLQLPVVISET